MGRSSPHSATKAASSRYAHRDLLTLKFTQGMSDWAIAGSPGVSKGAVGNYLMRFTQAGLLWPLPSDMDDVSFELLLFPRPPMASLLNRPVLIHRISDTLTTTRAGLQSGHLPA
jgi:hypothetical protein